jgi:hypothetical protein
MEHWVNTEVNSLDELKNEKKLSINFKRIGKIITQPRLVFTEIETEGKKAEWMTPIIVVAVIVLLAGLLSVSPTSSSSSPSRQSSTSAQSNFGPGGMGGGGMGGGGPMGMQQTTITTNDDTSDDNTTQEDTSSSTILTKLLSALGSVLSFLLSWLILGSMVNLLSISMGGQANTHMALIFAAWAAVPVGVRAVMQIVYSLAAGAAISAAGLSGFVVSTDSNGLVFLSKLLEQVDIYMIWQAILLVLAVGVMTKLNNKKPIIVAAASMAILILLKSFLGLGIEQISNLEINSSVLNNLVR